MCSIVGRYQRFGGTFHFHVQGRTQHSWEWGCNGRKVKLKAVSGDGTEGVE